MKRRSAAWFYRLHNRMSKTKIPENVGDFRLMDRVVVEALKQLPERQRFMKGLFAWVGFRTVTIDYVRAPRGAGVSKFSGWALWNFALEGFTSFSTVPLKIWTYLGAVGAVGSFVYALFTVFYTLLHGISVPGYASLLVVVLFLGSVQLMSIGLLGEYISRIYLETKQRPTYLVRKTYGGGRGA
jgi:glycosyltransferase involved in cell wall biosynthesis